MAASSRSTRRRKQRGCRVAATSRAIRANPPVPRPNPQRNRPPPAGTTCSMSEILLAVSATTADQILEIPVCAGIDFPAGTPPRYIGAAKWLAAQSQMWNTIVFNSVRITWETFTADTTSGYISMAFLSDYMLSIPTGVEDVARIVPSATIALKNRGPSIVMPQNRTVFRCIQAGQFAALGSAADKQMYSPGRFIVAIPKASATQAVGQIKISYSVSYRGATNLQPALVPGPGLANH
uniref:Capsid protein n=1 Tax=Maize chlorotic mottle virus TaxID=12138 RepID=G3EX90_MCMV|nr:coat protein [Maize chlorotic mottle virus]